MTDRCVAPTTTTPLAPPATCGAENELPIRLVPFALAVTAPDAGRADVDDVQRELTCMLEQGHERPHHGLVLDLDGTETGSVWTRWRTGEMPAIVVVLADCGARSPDTRDACQEFAGHPGGHSWQLAGPRLPVEA